MKIPSATILLFLLTSGALAADAPLPPPVVTKVADTNMTVTGQRIVVPVKPDVIVADAAFAPGAGLPVHKHLYPHYVYVQEGTLTLVNVETGKTTDIPAGSFVAEPVNIWHYGVNNGTGPLKLLVIDQVPHGVKKNVVLKAP